MRKAAGYVSIFVMGFAVCLLMLRAYSGLGVARDQQARKNVLAILDKPPPVSTVPDTAMVAAAARIEPAVVNIDTLSAGSERRVDFFGNLWERPYEQRGKGSGVLISPDGFIVTNNHVIAGANIIRVTLVNGKQFDGRVIGSDTDADLAVVKIDGANLPSADLGDSSKLKVGEYVLAIGYPLGIGTTVTHGIISATDRRDLEISQGHFLKQAIQTDAPINRGNSGGALANINGQLIGINTAIVSENGGGNIGIGFAIPINAARSILKEMIARGRAGPSGPGDPFIGIKYNDLNPDAASQLGVPSGQGVVIIEVVPLTPAANAGLRKNDIVLAVDGTPVLQRDDIGAAVTHKRVGDPLSFRVMRADGQHDVKITLGRKPEGIQP